MIRHRYLVWPIAAGVWLSGVLWLIFHNFLMRRGEFGLMAHPLELWWLRAHGAFAFASLWLLGFLSVAHVAQRWGWKRQRASGAILLALYIWLVITGYLLYYAGGDRFRAAVSYGHWTLGVAALARLSSCTAGSALANPARRLGNTHLDRQAHEICRTSDAEFGLDLSADVRDRLVTQTDRRRDLRKTAPFAQQPQYLEVAFGQSIPGIRIDRPMHRELLGDFLLHVAAAIYDATQRNLQFLRTCVLADIAAGAGLQCACRIHLFRVHAENENARTGAHASSRRLSSSMPPIPGQMQVEKDQLGSAAVVRRTRLRGPLRPSKISTFGSVTQQAPQAVPDDRVIIHDQYFHDVGFRRCSDRGSLQRQTRDDAGAVSAHLIRQIQGAAQGREFVLSFLHSPSPV